MNEVDPETTPEPTEAVVPVFPFDPGTDALIDRWWSDHFPGSAVARDTQAWNVAFVAKEALKRLLKGSV